MSRVSSVVPPSYFLIFPLRSNRFSLREFAAPEMSNALLSLPAVVGEDFRSLGATPFTSYSVSCRASFECLYLNSTLEVERWALGVCFVRRPPD